MLASSLPAITSVQGAGIWETDTGVAPRRFMVVRAASGCKRYAVLVRPERLSMASLLSAQHVALLRISGAAKSTERLAGTAALISAFVSVYTSL